MNKKLEQSKIGMMKSNLDKLREEMTNGITDKVQRHLALMHVDETCETILKDEKEFRRQKPYASKHEYIEFIVQLLKGEGK